MISSGNKLSKNIFILLKPYKGKIIILTLCVLIASVMSVFTPIINRNIIDNGMVALNLEVVIKYTLLILAMVLADQILEFIEFKQSAYINNMLSLDLFLKAFRHTTKLKMSYFNETNIAQIMGEVNQDVNNISAISNKNVLVSMTQILKVIGGVIGLMLISWKLTLLVLGVIPLKLLFTALLSKMRRTVTQDIMEETNRYSFWYGETLTGISEIKLWNLYKQKIGEFIKYQKKLVKLKIKSALIDQVNTSATTTLESIIFNLLYIVGASMIIKSNLTLGGMFSFIMYSSFVVQPISLLTNIFYQLSSVEPAMKRYTKFLQNETESAMDKNPVKIEKKRQFPEIIRFEDITLNYGNECALRNVSLEIKRGQKIAIIGVNGSGKSSLINLLLRFYNPTCGRILMDDLEITNIAINDYRNLFAVMSQNVHLFNSTIEDNIKMFNNISEAEMMKSCISSDAINFVEKLSDKFKTVVGFRGSKLSGGERQKVALARTLAKNADILILDEATSNYDFESELVFNKIIYENRNYGFILIITHRPDILKAVDRILVLDDGNVVGFGSFEELYGKNSLFTSMVTNEYIPVKKKKSAVKNEQFEVLPGGGITAKNSKNSDISMPIGGHITVHKSSH